MNWWRWMIALPTRLRTAVFTRRAEHDLEDELAFHLEMQARANVQKGLGASDARLQAGRQFGGVDQSKERCRDLRPLAWFEDFVRDIHYALRTFRRSPGFVAVAVLVLGLGIGANTTMFSLLNGLLFRPLPVPAPQQLRYLHTLWARWPDILQDVPYRTFCRLAEQTNVFAGVALSEPDIAKIGTGIQPLRVNGERVTANYFDVLQVRPSLGRGFAPSDDVPGAGPALIVSDTFWRRVLNGNPRVVGSTVVLRELVPGNTYSGHHCAYTVVGVMPGGFAGISDHGQRADYWVPIRQRTTDHHAAYVEDWSAESGAEWSAEDAMGGVVVARLRTGVRDEQVKPAVLAVERLLRADDQDSPSMRREQRTLLYDGDRASSRYLPFGGPRASRGRVAMALMLVSTLVLLIGATNLSGVLLARGAFRRSEIAARLALGAGRARVVRQLLTESLLLSLAGTMVAVGIARLLVGLFVIAVPQRLGTVTSGLDGTFDVPIDLPALVFTAGLGVAAGLLVGLVPALQSLKTDVLPVLSGGSAPAATARSRALRWVLVPQIGLSLVLLLVAGVLVRTLIRAEFADRGLGPEKVLQAALLTKRPVGRMTTNDERRAEAERRRVVFGRLLERVRALPDVEQAAITDQLGVNLWTVSVAARSGTNRWVGRATVSRGYFETMGIPVLRGRAFDDRDGAAAVPVAIVCERLAERLWPGKEALGQHIAEYDPKTHHPTSDWLLVVGVVREVKRPREEELTTYSFYRPQEQAKASAWPETIVVRGRLTGREVKQAVLSAIQAADADVEINAIYTLAEAIDGVLYPRRLATAILAFAGFLGLLLSSLGLYGIVSYSAAQRGREIGIRTALGAERRDIVRLLLRDALVALAIGIASGAAIGLGAMRVVSSVVVGLPAMDAVTLVAVPALLAGVILAAGLAPARRAAQSNPIEVLRGL